MGFWKDKRVLVTGGAGFLGRFVVRELKEKQCRQIFTPRKKEFNLCLEKDIARLLKSKRPDIIIHLAAVVGGIGANRENPGKFFYENLLMGVQLMEQARLIGVQ